jgi:hypothetical protein
MCSIKERSFEPKKKEERNKTWAKFWIRAPLIEEQKIIFSIKNLRNSLTLG